jgi:hypothetical protein
MEGYAARMEDIRRAQKILIKEPQFKKLLVELGG